MTTLLESFGINAVIGKQRGMSVQEISNINKEMALIFGLNKEQSEKLVTEWVKTSIELNVMINKK